jgi:4,5-DOPA dioxygenase extradiol
MSVLLAAGASRRFQLERRVRHVEVPLEALPQPVEQLARAPADILKVTEHPDFDLAVPTPDHFIPLLYQAGLADAQGAALEPLVRGYAMGSISMTCYGLDAKLSSEDDLGPAARLPRDVPPDQTNM